jgi:hypothetical protein
MLTHDSLMWAAGFLEGEGYFGNTRHKNSVGHRVVARQADPEPLKRLRDMFGGRLHVDRKVKGKHSVRWEWYATGERARHIMNELYSQMFIRRKAQIRKALGEHLVEHPIG